jgi:DNA-binding transcriptional regulator YiaG
MLMLPNVQKPHPECVRAQPMPNIGSVLRQEIARLSRREIRGEIQATRKSSNQYRHHIAALRKQMSALERRVAVLQRAVANGRGASGATTDAEQAPKLRFAASRLRSQRFRHGLTAADYARLLGVSEQTIYNWEHGTHRPGSDRLQLIAALRGMGKRAVQAQLANLQEKKKAVAKTKRQQRARGARPERG